MQSMTTAVRGTPLVAKAPAARRSRRVVAARAQQLCGLTEEEAAARLALAPPSVQAFIKRWGHREGIEAYAAACEIKWCAQRSGRRGVRACSSRVQSVRGEGH